MARMNACRCCGCTEDNACEGGCSWAPIERGIRMSHVPPIPPLCSVCSGTIEDLIEAHKRIAALRKTKGGHEVADHAAIIARAAVKRWNERHTKTDKVRSNRHG